MVGSVARRGAAGAGVRGLHAARGTRLGAGLRPGLPRPRRRRSAPGTVFETRSGDHCNRMRALSPAGAANLAPARSAPEHVADHVAGPVDAYLSAAPPPPA